MDKKRFYLKILSRIILGLLGVFAILVLIAYLIFGRGGEAPRLFGALPLTPPTPRA